MPVIRQIGAWQTPRPQAAKLEMGVAQNERPNDQIRFQHPLEWLIIKPLKRGGSGLGVVEKHIDLGQTAGFSLWFQVPFWDSGFLSHSHMLGFVWHFLGGHPNRSRPDPTLHFLGYLPFPFFPGSFFPENRQTRRGNGWFLYEPWLKRMDKESIPSDILGWVCLKMSASFWCLFFH